MSKASDPFFTRNDYTCIEINIFFVCNDPVFCYLFAYSGRFATLNNVDFPVSQMNRMLTNKVGTAKRKKLKELQVTKNTDITE